MGETLSTIIWVLGSLGPFALVGAMLAYFPTRRELSAHEKLDDTRFACVTKSHDEIKAMIRDTKDDLIRELKNGRSDNGIRN